jgi:hypothetical protein
MSRASYRHGVEWIALNDEANETEADEMAGLISVGLLADLFDKDPLDVARAVIRFREKHAQ